MNRNIVLCVVLLSALATQAYALWETKWEDNGVVICDADSVQGKIQIISDGSGGAIMTWWHESTVTPYWDIYAQKVDSLGNCPWASNGVLICDQTYEDAIVLGLIVDKLWICSDGAGGAIISWVDCRSTGPGNWWETGDIYAQRVDSSGVFEWAVNGIVICNAEGGQYEPRVCYDGSGNIIAWEDTRRDYPQGHFYDIYAQRVGPLIPGVDETRTNRLSKPITLSPGFPNPFSDKVKISYSISKKMKVKLKVYDVAGHLVKTLVDRIEEPGSKIIEWHSRTDDGSVIPNGVYFCQLETDNFSQTRKLVLLK